MTESFFLADLHDRQAHRQQVTDMGADGSDIAAK